MKSNINHSLVLSLWGNKSCNYVAKSSVGKSVGILAIWDSLSFSLISLIEGEGFLALIGTWTSLATKCLMIIVYAPQDLAKKKLWLQVSNIINNSNILSIVLGDFNEVRSSSERMGSSFCPYGSNYFNQFIFNSGLLDLPMGGKRFTRMNKEGTKLSKIDRILVSNHIIDKWPHA